MEYTEIAVLPTINFQNMKYQTKKIKLKVLGYSCENMKSLHFLRDVYAYET